MISTFTVLGGGSAYTPGLLAALLHHRDRHALREVRLHDLDEARLDVVARLGAKMAAGAFAVRAVRSLDEAIAGTDAVLNSTRPGGLEARRVDETVPVELGIPGQETVGPGGYFFAQRSVPEALRVAEVMVRAAPRAWLLNYTNPTNIVTQALAARFPQLPLVGMCDQSDGDLEVLGQALGLRGRPRFDSTGTNHATWYTGVRFGEGAPLTRFPAALADLASVTHHDEEHARRFECSLELSREAPGAWPNSYLPYYTHPDVFVALARRGPPRAQVILDRLPSYYRHFEEEAAKEQPQLRFHRGTAGFGDMAVEVLSALSTPRGQRLVLNLPSRGTQPGFDADTVVELAVEVRPEGLVRLPGPPPPAAFATLHRRIEAYQRAAALSVVSRDRPAEIAALALNPLVGTAERAASLLDAHAESLRFSGLLRPLDAQPLHAGRP